MPSRFLALAVSLLWSVQLFAQLEAQVDAIMADYADRPGAAIGVYQNGEILFQKGYGLANLDYDMPITPQTVFDIGSVSKQFTAACIVLLQQEGKLSLDDPIQKHIPEFPVYPAGEVTIRHLLHHTSGIRDYLGLMYLGGIPFDNVFVEEDGLEILLRQHSLNFPPGDQFLYSNSGYLLLAIIVRRVSGMSIGEYAQKHIFEPLGMEHSFVYEDGGAVVKHRATAYVGEYGNYRREHHVDFVVGGDGQVYTTIEDFVHWAHNFDEPTVGGQPLLDTMLTQGVLNDGEVLDYALGLGRREYQGFPTVQHTGSWGGFRAAFIRFPTEGFSVAVMSNYGGFGAMQVALQVADLLLEAKEEEVEMEEPEAEQEVATTIKLSNAQLEAFCGEYWQAEEAYSRRIYLRDDTLRYFRALFNESPLVPLGENEFKMLGVSVDLRTKFLEDADGKRMIVTIDGGQPIVSRAYEKASYKADELSSFTGRFYSPELDVHYDLLVKNSSLYVSLKGVAELPLTPVMADLFSNDLGTIEFIRDEEGALNGFLLQSGRVRDLLFFRE